MQIGLLGLGKMGSGLALRLVQGGHDVVGLDIDAASRAKAEGNGARTVATVGALVQALTEPRVVWVMLPPGELTSSAIDDLADHLAPGDLIIDGGNSDFRDAPARLIALSERGIDFADIGVSGGQWGWQNGYGLMVGANMSTFLRIEPALKSLATPGGYSRVGEVGSGHLVKAIHNGIQYGVLEAYAEGFALLQAHPEVDTLAAMTAWQGGSSIRSWLLEQVVASYRENTSLEGVGAEISDSGMGRWTAEEAIRLGIAVPVLAAGLHARFASRANGDANRLIVASRSRIGGQKS